MKGHLNIDKLSLENILDFRLNFMNKRQVVHIPYRVYLHYISHARYLLIVFPLTISFLFSFMKYFLTNLLVLLLIKKNLFEKKVVSLL